MAAIDYPPRVDLARAPTPLEPLPRTGAELGVELWIKRDDLTGLELTGNKVRKLEFLLEDARAAGADHLITCGGEQSNHARATAFAAARAGLGCTLLLRTRDPAQPPPLGGNILLDRLVGADIVWISYEEYRRRGELMAREADRLRDRGRTPYVIPEGGSNAVGAWGYVRCAAELAADLAALPPMPTTVIHACGSGGTSAGLVLGARIVGLDARLACVNVCDDAAYFTRIIDSICADFTERYGRGAGASAADIDIVNGYVGRGYGKSRPEELALLVAVARREGLVLDPTYTGKAFFGLTRELAEHRERFAQRVVFIHTGGAFGTMAAGDVLEPSLE